MMRAKNGLERKYIEQAAELGRNENKELNEYPRLQYLLDRR